MLFESQFASVTIGRMICKGKKQIAPQDLMESCSNMKLDGMTSSGNFILNDESVVFCDFSKQVSDSALQQHLGDLHYTDNDIERVV